MKYFSNSGKNLIIEIKKQKYARYPIKTHFIEPSDKIENIIEKYVLSTANDLIRQGLKKELIIVLGQKIISILQNRIIYKKDLKVDFWAKFLSKFVNKTPAGPAVGDPLKMQIAINLAGLPRILFACFCSGVGKIFKVYGIFYQIAGHQINQIDGFCDDAFPQYIEMGILSPKNCDSLCEKLKNKYDYSFIVADINDLGGNILGTSKNLKNQEKLLLEILKDNPAGQSNEQTPIIIISKI